MLKDKPVEIEGNKVTVYLGTKFFKQKVDTPEIKNLLAKNLSNAEIIFLAEKKTSAPPALSGIIEIEEEVEVGDEF